MEDNWTLINLQRCGEIGMGCCLRHLRSEQVEGDDKKIKVPRRVILHSHTHIFLQVLLRAVRFLGAGCVSAMDQQQLRTL